MDREQRRRRQRRQAVVELALDLFEERGYDATTVEAITEEAGISRRTFYRYFDSKDDILAATASTLVEEVLADTGGQPTIGALARRFAEIAHQQLQDRRTALVFRLLREHPELRAKAALWRQQWADELAEGFAQRDGRPKPSIEDVLVSRIAITTTAVAVDRWLTLQGPASIADHTKDALNILQNRL